MCVETQFSKRRELEIFGNKKLMLPCALSLIAYGRLTGIMIPVVSFIIREAGKYC